ncbi:ROK family protein [Cohnella herbarum]|uniref:ROK family protein n=1 Tax=Cohnella herbarum TaxID=2728023 RepID=A0A7Z2VMQ6_9BACL|nr:ROK family protein [Cohnella herbarum]QJD85914.1 ROK family protein [Cohnella herbarum]
MELYRSGIGIDIGGTKILAALATEQGDIVEEMKLDTAKTRSGLLSQLDDVVGRFTDLAFKRGVGTPQGIGIGFPGKVSEQIVNWVPNLPELNGLDLGTYANERWAIPARLQNDGQLALYGEQWLGAAQRCQNVLMFTLGTGIGGGIMVDGKVLRGVHGTAGSMGWLTMDLNDAGDPEQGWMERMVSGTGINRRASMLSTPLSSRELFDKAAAGDAEAMELVHQIGYCIGGAVGNLASVFDPEVVLIGGGVSLQLDRMMPSIRNAIKRFGSPSTRDVPIAAAKLLEKAGLLGAVRLAFL